MKTIVEDGEELQVTDRFERVMVAASADKAIALWFEGPGIGTQFYSTALLDHWAAQIPGLPIVPGVWVWEGLVREYNDADPPIEFLIGGWHRPSSRETAQLLVGKEPFLIRYKQPPTTKSAWENIMGTENPWPEVGDTFNLVITHKLLTDQNIAAVLLLIRKFFDVHLDEAATMITNIGNRSFARGLTDYEAVDLSIQFRRTGILSKVRSERTGETICTTDNRLDPNILKIPEIENVDELEELVSFLRTNQESSYVS